MVGAAREDEYHDPRAMGSLSGSLRMWQGVRPAGQEEVPHHLIFTLSCPSESRANRVAGHLRRSLACAAVRVSRVDGPGDSGWQVRGSTHFEIQTLARIERLSAWLRRSAGQHQVYLVGLALAEGSPLPA
jgi:hypothetical protein